MIETGDFLPDIDWEPETLPRGDTWHVSDHDKAPAFRHPIGFTKAKPRVRVKAWTRPILPEQGK